MDDKTRSILSKIHDALDRALGDTDPDIDEEMSDEEIRQYEPLFWAAWALAKLLA